MNNPSSPPLSAAPPWSDAPEGFDWCAQDADGRWFWYRTEPVLGVGGGVWRSNSRNQQFAAQGAPNPDWLNTLMQRPAGH